MNSPFHLADAVEIDGKCYRVHTDFRTWMGFDIIMSSDESDAEKCIRAIRLCYIDLPPRLDKAVDALIHFYTLGEKRRGGTPSEPLFDFEQDFGYIYASFMAEYGLDLFVSDIHWHAFMHLLRSLDENSIFKKIIGYRGADISKIKDKNMKAHIRRMKYLYALRCENDADIGDAF